jgi:hypothetical protein
MALPDDFKLIREIVAAGGSGYNTGNIDRSRANPALTSIAPSYGRTSPPARYCLRSRLRHRH